MISVPFIGCRTVGQVDANAPPSGSISLPISGDVAKSAAYYGTDRKSGVLAPRGGRCLGVIGSDGDAMIVHPWEFDDWPSVPGPGVATTVRLGEGSGRFSVADAIARLFPTYRNFVKGVVEEFPFFKPPSGPYPGDRLVYKSARAVEYQTPRQIEGLGTQFWLNKDAQPIQGVAMLVGPTPDLLHLAVRLPSNLDALTPVIIHQTERNAARLDR